MVSFLALVPVWRVHCSQSRRQWGFKITCLLLIHQSSAKKISNGVWMEARRQGDIDMGPQTWKETTSSPYMLLLLKMNLGRGLCLSKLKNKIKKTNPCGASLPTLYLFQGARWNLMEFSFKIFNFSFKKIKAQAFWFYWNHFSLLNLSYKFNNVNQQ